MSPDRTQTFFHQYAGDFDAIYGNQNGLIDSVINRLFRKSMRLRYEKSIAGCEPVQGKSVLDVGCGPGHYAITLAQRGAARVIGIDFADGMLKLAAEHAKKVGVGNRCQFMVADFYTYEPQEIFDYVIVMGFMDYMPDAEKVVAKVLSLTRHKAFFSFPAAGGILAWQRQLRYKKRCDLFLYGEQQIRQLCAKFPEAKATIEPISRDFFVTLERNGKTT
ncbi:MAG TPA: methyltransferase domain-containing protein [Terriglobales bacterium]|nr:methyltransferase domain-containing protein [Terriglobales bacterium]